MNDQTSSLIQIKQLLNSKDWQQGLKLLMARNSHSSSQTFSSLVLESDVQFRLKAFTRAEETAKQALETAVQDTEKAVAYKNLGCALVAQDNLNAGAEALKECVDLDNNNAFFGARYLLCSTLYNLRDIVALEKYAKPLKSSAKYGLATLKLLAQASEQSLNKKLYINSLNSMAEQYKSLDDASAAYVLEMLIGQGELARAENLLDDLKGIRDISDWSAVFEARLALIYKDFSQCLRLLSDDNIQQISESIDKSVIHQCRARAFEAQGKYGIAFREYEKMSHIIEKRYQQHRSKDVDFDEYRQLKLDRVEVLRQGAGTKDISMCFMTGFPRSGMTLLETLLSNSDDSLVLSEVNPLYSVRQHIQKAHKLSPGEFLNSATQTQLHESKSVYFSSLEKLGLLQTGFNGLLVDNMPYNTPHLPLISSLFPSAKIVFCLRHPYDVVLSCFQQNFKWSKENQRLVSLSDCCEYYDEVMSSFEKLRASLDLDIHLVKYEDLVENTDREVTRLSEFLQWPIKWQGDSVSMLSKGRLLKTASKYQVSQDIYQTSAYKWRNYQAELAPFRCKLDKWVDIFGYLRQEP